MRELKLSSTQLMKEYENKIYEAKNETIQMRNRHRLNKILYSNLNTVIHINGFLRKDNQIAILINSKDTANYEHLLGM